MEATRMRKENQVYSAEEKKMLSEFSKEERDRKESKVLAQFKKLVQDKMDGKIWTCHKYVWVFLCKLHAFEEAEWGVEKV